MLLKKTRPELFPQLQNQTDPNAVANIMEKLNGVTGGMKPANGQNPGGQVPQPMPAM